MDNRNASKRVSIFGNDIFDDHSCSIVHIDIDCFYAQIEMIKDPSLRSRPLGIRQKNIIVTSNYVARNFGIKKCMPVSEGLMLCPALALVRGEDLRDYRKASDDIFALLQKLGCPVEKLGMDENFIDVTCLVEAKMVDDSGAAEVCGHTYDGGSEEKCDCGCVGRLTAASHVARHIRDKLREELNITCSAGIAHNKLLAKLAGALNKPDRQTTLFAASAPEFMASLGSVRMIPGIGAKTAEALSALGLNEVADLQACDDKVLRKTFSDDIASKLKNLSLGIDRTEVKTSGRPSVIGLEDSFETLSVRSEVHERFATLLGRLVALAAGDGRRPGGLKVTVRQRTARRPAGHRETRHANVSPSLFTFKDSRFELAEGGREKLMIVVMRLFHKLVDLSKPFHLTLVGLAFTKFQERMTGRSSVANYFTDDVSVQTVLSLHSDLDCGVASMDCGPDIPGSVVRPEEEPEPLAKRMRRRTRLASPSPSKLRVADLHLGVRSPDVSTDRSLPDEDSAEENFERSPDSRQATSACGYFKKRTTDDDARSWDSDSDHSHVKGLSPESSCSSLEAHPPLGAKRLSEWNGRPRDVDREVFSSLPADVQNELRATWNITPERRLTPRKGPTNPITRYFIPNKQ